jgi:predicted NBD/HSP70 family sugar kinase
MGGGVIEAVDLIFDVAAETARREALQTPASKVEIVRAGLGDNSGVVGAAIMERRA